MSKLVVGVDLDGVLVNQIETVLPRLRSLFGVSLEYEDIVEWKFPVADTDIYRVIVSAMSDPEYVREMKAYEGASTMLRQLGQRHRVIIITARPPSTSPEATRRWLIEHDCDVEDIRSAEEGKKSLHGADVLVDDYLGNVEEFLSESEGYAILVDRPWNRRERNRIRPWIDTGRAFVVQELSEVAPLVDEIQRRKGSEPGLGRSSAQLTNGP